MKLDLGKTFVRTHQNNEFVYPIDNHQYYIDLKSDCVVCDLTKKSWIGLSMMAWTIRGMLQPGRFSVRIINGTFHIISVT